jgi:hypothetical protein
MTEGKLAAIFIKPSLEISNWPVIYYTFPRQLGTRSFLSPLPGIEEEAPTSSSPRHHIYARADRLRKIFEVSLVTHVTTFCIRSCVEILLELCSSDDLHTSLRSS